MTLDIGEYCRQVEDYLTRVNGGHLVRIVGPGFELVRSWAEQGIPLSVVFHGIDLKAERHRAGKSTRPLRIEFCEADVRDVFAGWRRAVGLTAHTVADANGGAAEADERRRPSLTRHIDRAIDKLSRAAGRVDLPEQMGPVLTDVLDELAAVREGARSLRGAAREELLARLEALDRRMLDRIRSSVGADIVEAARRQAEQELAPFRERLRADDWTRAIGADVDRLLRERLGLPLLSA